MKILYFGTVCHIDHYEKIIKNCKKKPTVATIVFESALLQGFAENETAMEVYCFPMIPIFPSSNLLYFGGKEEVLSSGYSCHWLKTINLPFLKQWSRRLNGRKVLKRWCKENVGEGVILTYSIPPFLAKDMVRLGKKYGIKTIAIVPDLPRNMYMNHKKNRLVYIARLLYLRSSIRYQDKFDGYVYLTPAMPEKIAPRKPYVIVEGIFSTPSSDEDILSPQTNPRAIMYAGQLHEKYGIIHLLDAFERLQLENTELWLFGEGTAVPEILRRAEGNSNIRFFGRVSRDEILRREKQATLLVNPRSTKDDFTKYSFPSKTIEYMYSGTPLLTTRLKGIPNEYFDYVFSAEDNTEEFFDAAIREALLLSDKELREKGLKARNFILTEKNSKRQSEKVICFIEELLRNIHEVEKKDGF